MNEKDREIQEKYHVLMETSRRLESTVQLEVRAQKHLSQAATSCQTLTKELLAGLQIGVQIGVPSNVKHKTQLWSGTSPTHSSRASRGLLLRAKTLSGDLHSNYIQARAIQGKIAILPPLEVVSLTRLPDVRSKDALNENVGVHQCSNVDLLSHFFSVSPSILRSIVCSSQNCTDAH